MCITAFTLDKRQKVVSVCSLQFGAINIAYTYTSVRAAFPTTRCVFFVPVSRMLNRYSTSRSSCVCHNCMRHLLHRHIDYGRSSCASFTACCCSLLYSFAYYVLLACLGKRGSFTADFGVYSTVLFIIFFALPKHWALNRVLNYHFPHFNR